MNLVMTTRLVIYSTDADANAIFEALSAADPTAGIYTRPLEGEAEAQCEAIQHGWESITTVATRTMRGAAPRFATLFADCLVPFIGKMVVHCIERQEEDLPYWAHVFDEPAGWKVVGANTEIAKARMRMAAAARKEGAA